MIGNVIVILNDEVIYVMNCSLDDLLRAGINLAENVVVVNKELSNSAEEDSLSDCNTIVAVQTMFKYAFSTFLGKIFCVI